MKGFIEIKEDSYEDTIEHLHRIKLLACKLIKMLSEHSEVYDKDDDYEDEDEDIRDRRYGYNLANYGLGGCSCGNNSLWG